MRLISIVVLALATAGYGIFEGVTGAIAGVVVREHQTEHLICATAIQSEAVSVSCVRRD